MALLLLKVILRSHGTAIAPGYRPSWVSDKKPNSNCAVVWLITEGMKRDSAQPAILQPLKPELWDDVQQGDVLRAMEGNAHVVTARVLKVYRTE